MQKQSNRTSILVVSCDAYKDLWRPFFKFFWMHWPDCPYPIYLLTNNECYEDDRVTALQVGEDQDWSSNLISALSRVETDHVLMLLDDFLLYQSVNTVMIMKLEEHMERLNASYIRLVAKPASDESLVGWDNVGIINKGSNYRFSTQAALWNKNVLSQLLQPGESIWVAEIEATKRSCQLESLFLSVNDKKYQDWPICYLNSVIKRKWTPEAVCYCRQNRVYLDFSVRKVCNFYDQLRRQDIFVFMTRTITRLMRIVLGKRLYDWVKSIPLLRRIIY